MKPIIAFLILFFALGLRPAFAQDDVRLLAEEGDPKAETQMGNLLLGKAQSEEPIYWGNDEPTLPTPSQALAS